jgi:hypothetical protein
MFQGIDSRGKKNIRIRFKIIIVHFSFYIEWYCYN